MPGIAGSKVTRTFDARFPGTSGSRADRIASLAISICGCVPAAVSGGGIDGSEAATRAAVPSRLTARGTEPFWAVDVDAGERVWKTPERPEGAGVQVERHSSGKGVRDVDADRTGLELMLTPGRCSDGMSDLVYPYSATWVHDGRTWRGCALPRD